MGFIVITCVPFPGPESNVQERLEVVKCNLEDLWALQFCGKSRRSEKIGDGSTSSST